jgi:hypothetical protein
MGAALLQDAVCNAVIVGSQDVTNYHNQRRPTYSSDDYIIDVWYLSRLPLWQSIGKRLKEPRL